MKNLHNNQRHGRNLQPLSWSPVIFGYKASDQIEV